MIGIENYHRITTDLFKIQLEFQNKIFEKALRNNAIPPVKGEITKGKLKWRGLRLIHQQKGLDYYSWIEQRGKQISPKVS
jgi:hypothetical protein